MQFKPPARARQRLPATARPGQARQLVQRIVGSALLVLAPVLAGCSGGASGAEPEVLNLKLGHVSSPGSLVDVAAIEFVRRVNEELAGRVHVDLFGSGQLGSDEVLMVKLKLGTVDFAAASTVVSSTIEEFGFFEIPYLFRDRDHLRLVAEDVFWPRIAPFSEEKGLKVLGLWEHGFRQITNNARPIIVPEDLGGIKLRTPSGFWRINAFLTFDANPTAMPLTEVFVALQTGVIDGQENPMHQIYSSRFHEVQEYLSMSNHVYSPIFLTVGAEKWATHPPEIRAEIERIAREVEEFSRGEGEKMDRELRQYFEDHGIVVNEVDRQAFIDASRPVYSEFGRQIAGGEEWIERTLELENEVAPAAAVLTSQAESADVGAE